MQRRRFLKAGTTAAAFSAINGLMPGVGLAESAVTYDERTKSGLAV